MPSIIAHGQNSRTDHLRTPEDPQGVYAIAPSDPWRKKPEGGENPLDPKLTPLPILKQKEDEGYVYISLMGIAPAKRQPIPSFHSLYSKLIGLEN